MSHAMMNNHPEPILTTVSQQMGMVGMQSHHMGPHAGMMANLGQSRMGMDNQVRFTHVNFVFL
jgi:hypothetical protein